MEQNVAAVMEPSGHFVLIDVADGHAIADLQLKPRPGLSMTDLAVVRLGDQYIVIVQDRSANGDAADDQMRFQAGTLVYPLRRRGFTPSICKESWPGRKRWTLIITASC